MITLPYRWFVNIIALHEKRAYSTYRIFLFSLFVGSVRLFAEWALGGSYPRVPLSSLVTVAGFYWLSFFVVTMVLRILVAQPWRVSINVILVGIFLGMFPPIIDTIAGGTGFEYGYVWSFVDDWRWVIYNPAHKITVGEASVLWAMIILTTAYVAHKTRSALRSFAAFVLAYGAVIFIASALADAAERTRTFFDWPGDHRVVLINLYQIIACMGIYLLLQPRLLKGLARRVPHALPFMLFVFLGSAVTDRVSETTAVYALLMFLAGLVALAQNDHFDAVEDSAQGREAYLDLEDVRFLTITAAMGVVVLASANSTELFLATAAFAAFSLYNFPFYRAKRYFPSNLKIEGIWGFTAFGFGVVAAVEHGAYEAPRWWASGIPMPLHDQWTKAFDPITLAAMLLAFGGFSLVAALKDYKDWEADQSAGVQTLYTLAAKRGWNMARLHFGVITVAAVAIASAPILLALAGKITWIYAPGGVIAGAAVWLAMRGAPSAPGFRRALVALTAYFLYLVIVLSTP